MTLVKICIVNTRLPLRVVFIFFLFCLTFCCRKGSRSQVQGSWSILLHQALKPSPQSTTFHSFKVQGLMFRVHSPRFMAPKNPCPGLNAFLPVTSFPFRQAVADLASPCWDIDGVFIFSSFKVASFFNVPSCLCWCEAAAALWLAVGKFCW